MATQKLTTQLAIPESPSTEQHAIRLGDVLTPNEYQLDQSSPMPISAAAFTALNDGNGGQGGEGAPVGIVNGLPYPALNQAYWVTAQDGTADIYFHGKFLLGKIPAPVAPILNANKQSNGEVVVTFGNPNNIAWVWYVLERKETGADDSTYVQIAAQQAGSYVDTSVYTGSNYTYRCKAVIGELESDYTTDIIENNWTEQPILFAQVPNTDNDKIVLNMSNSIATIDISRITLTGTTSTVVSAATSTDSNQTVILQLSAPVTAGAALTISCNSGAFKSPANQSSLTQTPFIIQNYSGNSQTGAYNFMVNEITGATTECSLIFSDNVRLNADDTLVSGNGAIPGVNFTSKLSAMPIIPSTWIKNGGSFYVYFPYPLWEGTQLRAEKDPYSEYPKNVSTGETVICSVGLTGQYGGDDIDQAYIKAYKGNDSWYVEGKATERLSLWSGVVGDKRSRNEATGDLFTFGEAVCPQWVKDIPAKQMYAGLVPATGITFDPPKVYGLGGIGYRTLTTGRATPKYYREIAAYLSGVFGNVFTFLSEGVVFDANGLPDVKTGLNTGYSTTFFDPVSRKFIVCGVANAFGCRRLQFLRPSDNTYNKVTAIDCGSFTSSIALRSLRFSAPAADNDYEYIAILYSPKDDKLFGVKPPLSQVPASGTDLTTIDIIGIVRDANKDIINFNVEQNLPLTVANTTPSITTHRFICVGVVSPFTDSFVVEHGGYSALVAYSRPVANLIRIARDTNGEITGFSPLGLTQTLAAPSPYVAPCASYIFNCVPKNGEMKYVALPVSGNIATSTGYGAFEVNVDVDGNISLVEFGTIYVYVSTSDASFFPLRYTRNADPLAVVSPAMLISSTNTTVVARLISKSITVDNDLLVSFTGIADSTSTSTGNKGTDNLSGARCYLSECFQP